MTSSNYVNYTHVHYTSLILFSQGYGGGDMGMINDRLASIVSCPARSPPPCLSLSLSVTGVSFIDGPSN